MNAERLLALKDAVEDYVEAAEGSSVEVETETFEIMREALRACDED